MVGNTNLVSISSKTSSLHQFPQDHSSNLKSFRQQQCWQSILAEWECWQCWEWKLPESALVLFPRVLGPPQSLLHLAQLVHSTFDSSLFVRNMVAMVYSWWWRINDDGYWWLCWWWIDNDYTDDELMLVVTNSTVDDRFHPHPLVTLLGHCLHFEL